MKHAKECEMETIGMMRIYGFKPPETKVLVYLSNGAEVSTVEIEKDLGLRQPEVNLAVNSFVKLGYVESTKQMKKTGKGRPIKYYKLVVPLEKIVENAAEKLASYEKEILENAKLLSAAYRSN